MSDVPEAQYSLAGDYTSAYKVCLALILEGENTDL